MVLDFDDWYRVTHPRLLASMLLLTGSLDEAREVTDEAFARAYERWDRVGAMDAPGGWTYRVAVNVVRRRARRRAVEQRLLARHPAPPDVPAPAGEAWALVADLPLRQRTAVVLRYVADLPEAGVAEAMGIRRSTVAATLTVARRRLGAGLAPETADG
jgi:RNA polymerase sigma-70 factor (ECF subfamily)